MLTALFVLLAVLLALTAFSATAVYLRPLAAFSRLSRLGLARAGMRRTLVPAPFGSVGVWTGGTGRTVVLLHGAGDQAGTWARIVPGLLARYRVLALDLPGHGGSDPRRGPLSVGTVLEGVVAVLKALAPGERTTLVGNSLGAWVALLCAATRPDLVSRVVLVNGGALKGERSDVTFTPRTREEARRTITALMGPNATRAPGFVLDDLIKVASRGALGRLTQTAGEMDEYILEGRLHEVAVPVDLLWGVDDEVFPLAYARRMLDGLPAARLTTLEGCGHVPHRTSPGRFTRALLDLLAQAAPAARDARGTTSGGRP